MFSLDFVKKKTVNMYASPIFYPIIKDNKNVNNKLNKTISITLRKIVFL